MDTATFPPEWLPQKVNKHTHTQFLAFLAMAVELQRRMERPISAKNEMARFVGNKFLAIMLRSFLEAQNNDARQM
jgi:hypothetical protein